MAKNQTETRIKNINKMLLELASGNFSYKIERSEKKDDIEALVTLVNMMAEEIKESFFHQGYVNLKETYTHLVQMVFVLDEKYIVKLFNDNVTKTLLYQNPEILDRPFIELLTRESKEGWIKVEAYLEQQENYSETRQLTFKTRKDLIVPAFCFITKLLNQNNPSKMILVSVIKIERSRKLRDADLHKQVQYLSIIDKKKNKFVLKQSDIQTIREVHAYILNNLEKPLPSLNELAHQLGTNEFKLKYGFKQLYGTTIFRFLIKERLRKASMLIQYSDMSLKIIAYKTGFKSFPHFSKVFKLHFKYTPSSLRKQFSNKL